MNPTRPILSFLLLFRILSMQAQQPAFYHLSTAEGLSDNNVSHVLRDRNGILWIATSEGLNSFDGNRITAYRKYDYPELADNIVERIVADEENKIWIRTSSPFVTMLDEKRRFHKYGIGDTTDRTSVSALFSSSKGIFAVRNRKHYLLKKETAVFELTSTPFDSLLGGTGFTQYLPDDRVLYYRSGRLVLADYGTMKTILDIRVPGLNGALNNDEHTLIGFNAPHNIFYRISIPEKKVVQEYRDIRDQAGQPIAKTLRNMCRIGKDRFAFTNYFSGLYLVDFSKQEAQHFVHDPVDPRSIGGNNTFNVVYDSTGYLFVTTQTSGIHFFNLKQKNVLSKPYFMDENKQVFDGFIQSVTTDASNTVWMGAQDRLIKWDRQEDKTWYVPLRLPGNNNISGTETIREVQVDADGKLWVGTSRQGLLILDRTLRVLKQITDSADGKKSGFPSRWVNTIRPDKQGNKWVGTLSGTCFIRNNDLSVIALTGHPVLGEMSKLPCASLWMADDGRIWIGTTRGAWCYDESKNSIQQYSVKDGLAHNTVLAINADDLGNTYFGTAGGLSVLSKEGKIKTYNLSNGLRNDRCEGILKDKDGYMWIANLNCIIRYDPKNEKFAVYEEGLGFSHGGFRMRDAHISSSGEMFWGTDKGLIYFYPGQMSITSLPLHPSIHALQTTEGQFHFTREDQLSFPHYTSSFSFSFSSGELTGDRKNHFLYRLNGYDEEWRKPVTLGQAIYSKLPAGSYSFEVKASRDGINWFEAPYKVSVYIIAPWWQQTWFRLLSLLLAACLGYFIFRYIRKRRKAREINQAIEYFANSGYEHASTDGILWDIARNCISRLGLEDCVIYITDEDRKVLVQKAAYGPKSPKPFEIANPIEIPFGKGIVGDVAVSGKAAMVNDTSKDSRYIVDDERRYSEISIPIIHDKKVIGVIDSEHSRKNFFTRQHLRALQTIASLCSAKIARTMAMESMQKSREELMMLNVKMAETKFLNLRLQMNPHFLFNSLSSIQHLIVSQQTNKAYKYLTLFSHFLRSLLNFAEKNFIPLDEELKILRMYVELESLRFDESFSWEITADESLIQDEVLVPSLMMQPFAENAIWHGLLHKEGEKKLTIRFTNNTEEYLSCVIEDNGIGREKALSIKESNINSKIRESKGIGIIKERLELLQQKTGKPATIKIDDLHDTGNNPAGTRVQITIPYYNPDET